MTDAMETLAELPMVFVTGASRSGTTMLSRMFGQHSEINGLKELHCFGELVSPNKLGAALSQREAVDLCAKLFARSKRDIWGDVEPEDITAAEQLLSPMSSQSLRTGDVVALALAEIVKAQGKHIPCEQTPRNIFYANNLLAFYPNLRIVHIVRDPRDVLASQKNRWKRKRLGGNNIPYSEMIRVWFNYHPFTITKLWKKATKLAADLSSHERVYVLRFEDIISDPEAELAKVCAFLGLPFESDMVNIPQVGSSHRTNADQTLGVVKSTGNSWVKILTPGEVAICEAVAAPLMSDYGYISTAGNSKFNFSFLQQIAKYPLHVLGVIASNPRRAWIQMQAVLVKAK